MNIVCSFSTILSTTADCSPELFPICKMGMERGNPKCLPFNSWLTACVYTPYPTFKRYSLQLSGNFVFFFIFTAKSIASISFRGKKTSALKEGT